MVEKYTTNDHFKEDVKEGVIDTAVEEPKVEEVKEVKPKEKKK